MNAERIMADLKSLTSNAERLIEATGADLSDKAKEARSRLRSALAVAKDNCESLQEKTVAGARATDKAIRKHPYQSLGVAFGVGLVLGVLAIRGSRG